MRRNPFAIFIFSVWGFALYACKSSFVSQSVQFKSYWIHENFPKDSALQSMLNFYSQDVHKAMNEVVGYAERDLEKKQPECTLGNFLADAFLTMAGEKYNIQVDAAFMNYGGIRLIQLPAGNVTRGKIFELMPFDNLLVIQKLKGNVLQQFLDHIASRGGWPVAGISMQIMDPPAEEAGKPVGQTGKKAVNVIIGGKPLDPDAVYTIVNSDYVANGGDNAEMLRNIPQITNGYLMRDAIFDYINKLKSQGKNINAKIENRISYAR